MSAAQQYLRPELLASVSRLDLRARFIVQGYMAGLNRSVIHGASVEFAEHRRYAPGDDVRLIDQNVLARTDRLFIRTYRAETNLDCHLLVDTSASMDWPPAELADRQDHLTKGQYAITLAAALGYLLVRQQDRVGAACLTPLLGRQLAPRTGRRQLAAILSVLSAELHASRAAQAGAETDLAEGLAQFSAGLRRRGMVVLLSDLLADPAGVIRQLTALRLAGHDVLVMQILDRLEVEFPFDGTLRLVDPESGSVVEAEPSVIRRGYREAMAAHIEAFRTGLRGIRADFLQVRTDMRFDVALGEFLRPRGR